MKTVVGLDEAREDVVGVGGGAVDSCWGTVEEYRAAREQAMFMLCVAKGARVSFGQLL